MSTKKVEPAPALQRIKDRDTVKKLEATTIPFFTQDREIVELYLTLGQWQDSHGLTVNSAMTTLWNKAKKLLKVSPSRKDSNVHMWALELTICKTDVQFLLYLSRKGLVLHVTPDKNYSEFILHHLLNLLIPVEKEEINVKFFREIKTGQWFKDPSGRMFVKLQQFSKSGKAQFYMSVAVDPYSPEVELGLPLTKSTLRCQKSPSLSTGLPFNAVDHKGLPTFCHPWSEFVLIDTPGKEQEEL